MWTDRLPATTDRDKLYLRFIVDQGMVERYGPFWHTDEREDRIINELTVIEGAGFSATFVMLADVLGWCRRQKIPVGPGRGSVGGCYVGFAIGIHDMDSIRWGLFFERFLNPERISFPDVDIDISQRHRPRVIQYIADTYSQGDQVVLQIGAFAKAGARSVVDMVAVSRSMDDDHAWATATLLKKCFPPDGSVVGGQKVARELHGWLYEGMGHGDKAQFLEIAERVGWLDDLLKLDGVNTHISKHAAGVVILRREDLATIPLLQVRNSKGVYSTVTAYDMYALDSLDYLKWDFLGLRTLDVIVDADVMAGGTGEMRSLLQEWEDNMEDPRPYEMLSEGDSKAIFQMDTTGYQRTLKQFKPTCFEDLIQLGALYRPGALDYRRESDGKNMVEVFIDRRHGREHVSYEHELLKPILEDTHGVILFQEQSMAIARTLAGFSLAQADWLRKAIGKKRPEEMAKLVPLWQDGCARNGVDDAVRDRIWANIEASARYSWNRAHAAAYGLITWWTAWKKAAYPAPFLAAEINSWDKAEKKTAMVSYGRQYVDFLPPQVNIATESFGVDSTKSQIVFGLNGVAGLGDSFRTMLLVERMMNGSFENYESFAQRLPSFQISLKLRLIQCGAFDDTDDRSWLLSKVPKGKDGEKVWTVAEHINHNGKLKNPRPVPEIVEVPATRQLAQMEKDATGYYLTKGLFADVQRALRRQSANVIGGEVTKLELKTDKRGGEYGVVQLTTPELTNQRVMIFSSNWPQCESKVVIGRKLLFRGTEDGNTFIAAACWDIEDVRHFKKIKIRDPKSALWETQDFNGELATIEALESAEYQVRLI